MIDLQTDYGESNDVSSEHPGIVKQLHAAYDRWWDDTLPLLVNQDAVGPAVNSFKEQYWKQLGGVPHPKADERILIEVRHALDSQH